MMTKTPHDRSPMRDLAPDITRVRLLIEGYYRGGVDEDRVREYLMGVAEHLELKVYGAPTIHSPSEHTSRMAAS